MNYILYSVKPDGNGYRDYCKLTFGCDIGKPKVFTWDKHYLIRTTNLAIV